VKPRSTQPPVDGRGRTLPLRVPPHPAEALDSWLLRLAHRNQIPASWLLAALGLGPRTRVWRNHTLVRDLPAGFLRHLETRTGLAPHTLDRAVLDCYALLGWRPTVGSRYCPDCLTASGGVWPLRWQLPHVIACRRHRCLLAAVCPDCGGRPHSGLSPNAGLLPTYQCVLRRRDREEPTCGADLRTHPVDRLAADDPRLVAQGWIEQRLTVVERALADPHSGNRRIRRYLRELHDLQTLTIWLRQRFIPGDVAHLEPATIAAVAALRDPASWLALRVTQPATLLVAAALTAHAVELLAARPADRYQAMSPLFRDLATSMAPAADTSRRPRRAPMILPHRRLAALSEPLRQALLSACDPHLPITERLRYRTTTAAPRLVTPGSSAAASRARHLPQRLWPDWIVRFQAAGGRADTLASDLPRALLLPDNPLRNQHAAAGLGQWTPTTTQTLRHLAESHPDVLTALCALADHLDTHGAPIDYQRRRATFADPALTPAQWTALCDAAGCTTGRAARHRHARQYLFTQLTGGDLTDSTHPLAFHSTSDRGGYHRFCEQLPTALRRLLDAHATDLLTAADIEEPLTWSPPPSCATGLRLPGADPDAIDLDALHDLHITRGVAPTTAARHLQVSLEHIRHALTRLHRPPAAGQPPRVRAAFLRRLERAQTLLTADYFDREHHHGGKSLQQIATDTGLTRDVVLHFARLHGVPTPRRAPQLDPGWLREQTHTHHRTAGQIAADCGLTADTVRRALRRHGIPARPSGGAGHTDLTQRYPQLPRTVRRAVEGRRHGWQRLRRFQQLAAYPSINSAAGALGYHFSNLSLQLQRLETDLGHAVIDRGPHRYQPMRLTSRGRRLLAQLDEPRVRQLLDLHAPAR